MVTFVDDSGAWLRPDLFVLIELRAIARQLLEAVVHGEPRGLLLDEAVALHGKVRVDREVGPRHVNLPRAKGGLEKHRAAAVRAEAALRLLRRSEPPHVV